MDDKKFFDVLCKNINYVIVEDKTINGLFDIKFEISIYSKDNKSKRLYCNENLIKLKNTKVNYTCETCGYINEIFLKKLFSKSTHNCNKCSETPTKRIKQSVFMVETYRNHGKILPKVKKVKNKKTNLEYIKNSIEEFKKESIDFQTEYFKNHVSIKEFNQIKPYIFKVNGILLQKDFVYYEYLKTNNQLKYSSYLYDQKNDILINFNNVTFYCENCGDFFKTTRKPKERLKMDKIFCKKCMFVKSEKLKILITKLLITKVNQN